MQFDQKHYIYPCIVLGAILVISALVFFVIWQIEAFLPSAENHLESSKKEVSVPMGSSPAEVASILEEEGVISSALVFRLYARYTEADQNFQAGTYVFQGDLSMKDIAHMLEEGVIYKEGTRFTIPEGFNVKQIASRLENHGLAEQEEFLRLCSAYENPQFSFLEEIPLGTNYKLEGYLFPETYEVSNDVSEEEIIKMMLAQFDNYFNDEHRARANELGLSMHQVVTLASLVEKEARVIEEMPLIARVFYNRLASESYPHLQSCATVQYVLGEVKPRLTYGDLQVESPYNTYLNPDLPPGPIASPGPSALKASLYPADADYLYFVYKEDGSGEHYFSETLQEHNYHREQARKNRAN